MSEKLIPEETSPLLGEGASNSLAPSASYSSLHLQRGESSEEDEIEQDSEPETEWSTMKVLNAKYQSLDYDTCENVLYQTEEKQKTYRQVLKKQVSRWLVMFLIGVLTGCIAAAINIGIHTLSNLKYSIVQKLFNRCIEEGCLTLPLLLWTTLNAAAVCVAAIMVAYIAPIAAGSGIPQIKCFLNGIKVPDVVRFKTLITKTVGVILSVVGGLAIGKEGPMIHSGAVVAAGISQGRFASLNLDFRLFEYFRTDKEKRDFVSGGAAAGVSAAFGAPVGGVLFSLEEGASFWNQGLTWRIFFASMVSTFSLNVIMSYFNNVPWNLSYAGLINFGKFSELTYNGIEVLIYMVMGLIGGLLGALFNHINYKLSIFRQRHVKRPWTRVIEAVIVAMMTTVTAFIMIYTIKDCQALGKDPIEYPLQVYCHDGEYSSIATMWLQTPENSVKSLFHDPPESYRPLTLILFGITYFLLACWTYGLSVPSGLFIPCLLTGAAWGRLFGNGMLALFPGEKWIDPGKFALVGAAAQLGGVVRMTISLTVILIEATGNISFGLPIMIVLMVAKWIGDIFNEGLYDIHIQLSSVPMLDWEPPLMTSNIEASEVMIHPVATLRKKEKIGRLMDVLKREKGNGFPITDISEETETNPEGINTFGVLHGLILRSQLIVLLQNKEFLNTGSVSSLKLKQFRDMYPRYPSVDQLHISYYERDCELDLTPFMNPAPYTVFSNTTLPRIFRLFRGLGLRHLVVTDIKNQVVGIVTRKDLARYKFHQHQGHMGLTELQIAFQK